MENSDASGAAKPMGKQAFGGDPGYDKGDGNANEKGGGEVVGHGKDGAPAAIEKAVKAEHKAYQDKVKAEGTQVFRAASDNGCIAGKDACKKGRPELYQHKAGNAKTQRQEDGVLHALLGAVLLAGAHILRNHRGQGSGKSSGRRIVKVLILPTTPSAAEAMTPIWLTMAVINKKEIFTSVSWKDTGSPKRSRVETFSRYKLKAFGFETNKTFCGSDRQWPAAY